MRDAVTLYRRLSLAGRKPRMLPMFTMQLDIKQDCYQYDGIMQKRRNSIANALELRLFSIKPLDRNDAI